MMLALFACNRPEFLQPCLASLAEEACHVYIFVDAVDEEGPAVADICRASGHPCFIEGKRWGTGYHRRRALQMFLDEPTLGNDLTFCDSDMLFGRGSLALLRAELAFWGEEHLGALACGCGSPCRWRVRRRAGHAIIPHHGCEAATMMTREALTKVGNCILLCRNGNTRRLKNRLAEVQRPRATLVEPMPQVQHIGAFRSSLHPELPASVQLFYDLQGQPLNPRPDLYNVYEQLAARRNIETEGRV